MADEPAPNSDKKELLPPIGIERKTARFTKLTVPSMDLGTYYFNNPSVIPNTQENAVSIDDLENIFWTNPVVNKGVNLRANRIIGTGFELMPSDHSEAQESIAQEAADRCWQFFQKIGGFTFLRQSIINAYVAGNEWTEVIYNQLDPKNVIHCAHGDFRTIDFRRNFLNNKILLDDKGNPVGYWQYIEDLSQLYHSLAVLYGNLDAYRNILAEKERLLETQSLMIKDEHGTEIAMIANKPNFMFLKEDEIVHLSFNNLNDNWYGTSLILPAYTSLTHLQEVMYATAEAINDMGYPKPVVTVGDEKNAPTKTLMDAAQDAVKDPLRKESFVIPFYMKMDYLQPTVGQNMSEYPEWFINASGMGLRVPRELLTGEGSANYASASQNATDFDKDIESDRRQTDLYLRRIFSLFLNTHGYKQSAGGDSIYIPKIKYPDLVTEDETKRTDMALQMWNANLVTFNEVRKLLKMPETEEKDRGEAYANEAAQIVSPELQKKLQAAQAAAAPPAPTPGQEVAPESEKPAPIPEGDQQQAVLAQHKLDTKEGLKRLNTDFKTADVDYKKVAQESVGKKIVSVDKDTARKIRDAIVNMEAKGRSAADILIAIMKIGNLDELHARMIMETETQNLAEHGRLKHALETGMKHKMWVAQMDKDTSPLCRALNGKILPVAQKFTVKYKENGVWKTWSGDAPAAHPHCRSHLAYSETGRFSKDDILIAKHGKEKIYLKQGERAPQGYQTYKGKRGANYYIADPRQAAVQKPAAAPAQKKAEPQPRQAAAPKSPPRKEGAPAPPPAKPAAQQPPPTSVGIPEVISKGQREQVEKGLLDYCKESYGSEYTQDPGEAGFIFQNGKMPKMGKDGQRGDDHRVAARFVPKEYRDPQDSRWSDLKRFMQITGAIRLQYTAPKSGEYAVGQKTQATESGAVSMSFIKPPTPNQMGVIARISAGKDIYAEWLNIDQEEESLQNKHYKDFDAFSKFITERKATYNEDIMKDPKVKGILRRFARHDEGMGGEISFKDPDEAKIVLDHGHYALISAGRNPGNPADANLSAEELKARSQKLHDDLIAKGYMFTPVIGKYGELEDSFLVMAHNPDDKDMIELAGKYNQESVIIVKEGMNKLIYTGGDRKGQAIMGEGYENVDEKSEDNYTEMALRYGSETAPKKVRWTLRFDWEHPHRIDTKTLKVEEA